MNPKSNQTLLLHVRAESYVTITLERIFPTSMMLCYTLIYNSMAKTNVFCTFAKLIRKDRHFFATFFNGINLKLKCSEIENFQLQLY